jgi:uncharacterized membrane protein
MAEPHPRSTARIGGHPIHPMLVPFPIAFFVAVFVTDLLYVLRGEAVWAGASYWLLIAGLVTAALAALAGLADFLGERRIRGLGIAWAHMIGNVAAVVLQLVNLLIRLDDRTVAVEGLGVILSGVVVALLLVTGWLGGDLVYRHGVGVLHGHSDVDEAGPHGAGVRPH